MDFYSKKLKYFLKYCEGQALTRVSQLSTDLIRRYMLELSETHNPGGVHACFRPLRTLLYWVEEEEIMPQGWKNPIRRVKAPKLPTEPIEPIHVEEINLLLKTCDSNYSGARDKAIMLGLLDTGARARELLNINLEDVELATGSVMIRQGNSEFAVHPVRNGRAEITLSTLPQTCNRIHARYGYISDSPGLFPPFAVSAKHSGGRSRSHWRIAVPTLRAPNLRRR